MPASEAPGRAKSGVSAAEARGGGWIVAASFAAFLVVVGVSFGLSGAGEEGLRLAVRLSARVSAALLAVVFSASSVSRIARAGWSKALLRRRRELGLGFAAAHFGHLGVVIALAVLFSESFWRTTSMTGVIGGSIGYVWVAAMSVTSFSGPRRRVGPRAWRALHTSGIWLLWGIFVFSYAGRAPTHVIAASFLGLMLVALGLRIAARLRGREPGAAPSEG